MTKKVINQKSNEFHQNDDDNRFIVKVVESNQIKKLTNHKNCMLC